jgi:hypothetical protein
MRRTIFGIAVLCALAVPVSGQRTFTFQALVIDNTSGGVAIAAATLSGMASCEGRLETAEIRWTPGGGAGAPTTTVGQLLYIGDVIKFTNVVSAASARFIRTGATSGQLDIQCESR